MSSRQYAMMFMSLDRVTRPFLRHDKRRIQVGDHPQELLDARDCRRLAAWLERAAKWIEAEKGAKG